MPQKEVGKRSSITFFAFGTVSVTFWSLFLTLYPFFRHFFARLLLPDSFCGRVNKSHADHHFFANGMLGSQHPSPNVKTFCKFEAQIWLEIITSRDAKSACFKGSRTSCREIIFGIFWPNFGQKRSHHVMDASCRYVRFQSIHCTLPTSSSGQSSGMLSCIVGLFLYLST